MHEEFLSESSRIPMAVKLLSSMDNVWHRSVAQAVHNRMHIGFESIVL